MPLPGSPLRNAVASAARMPAAPAGASTTRPPSSGSGSPPTLRSMTRASSLSTTRVAPQWPGTRTRSSSQPGSVRMRSSTANAAQLCPNTASGSTSSSGSSPRNSGIGTASTAYAASASAAPASAAPATGSACPGGAAGAARLATGTPTVAAGQPPRPASGMPERHSTTGPGNTSLPVRSRHPAPSAASERAMRSGALPRRPSPGRPRTARRHAPPAPDTACHPIAADYTPTTPGSDSLGARARVVRGIGQKQSASGVKPVPAPAIPSATEAPFTDVTGRGRPTRRRYQPERGRALALERCLNRFGTFAIHSWFLLEGV